MRVLLDECVPRKLKSSLTGHECRTVPEEGMAGKRNGELLTLAEKAGFEVFLSVDRGIEFQHNLRSRRLAVSRSSRLADLRPHVPETLRRLEGLRPGEVVSVG